MVDKLADLIGPDGDESLVATLLPVLLLEHDARHPPNLPLLLGNVFPRLSSRDSEDRLVVLWVRPWESREVLERAGEVANGGIGVQDCRSGVRERSQIGEDP